jgi:hypothetical protein
MTVSQGIFKWMEENKDFFKPQGVCKKVGIDKGNFSRYKKDGAIPEKYLQPIMKLIMPLGFTLGEVIAENNKPETKKKIEAEQNGGSKFKHYDYSAMPAGLNYQGREAWKKKARIEQDKN